MTSSARSLVVTFLVALMGTTAWMATVDAEAVDAKPRKIKKKSSKGFSKNSPLAGFKGAYVLSGTGESELSGESGSSTTTEYEDDATYGVNGHFLFPVAQNLRVGGSVWLWPKWDVKVDGQPSETEGEDALGLDLNIMAEYALDFGKIDGFAYAEAGVAMLFPPEPEDENVQTEPETGIGYNAGGGVGGGFPISRQLALRVDVKFTVYSITTTTDIGDRSLDSTFSGNRLTLNAGVAFGL